MARALLVVLDDCGIDQLACYGSENSYSEPHAYANTPNIDALAASGVRFNQARAHPVCSPTRSAFLTGCYPFRTGCGTAVQPEWQSSSFVQLGQQAPVVALPSLLSGPTFWTGKAHLGLYPANGGTFPQHALSLGFDSFLGTLANLGDEPMQVSGAPGYVRYMEWNATAAAVSSKVETEYATVHVRRNASRWIVAHQDFQFLYLCFHAAHSPYLAASIPPAGEHGFGSFPPAHKNTIARAMLECVDRQLGILKGQLPSDTYVFLVADNGTSGYVLQTAAGEVRYPVGHPLAPGGDLAPLAFEPYDRTRAKQTVYETGIRVPLIVSGPGVDAHECSDLVDAVDIFATIAELLGVSVPAGVAQDSISFAGCLTGSSSNRDFSFSEQFTLNGTTASERTVEDRCYIREDGPERWKLVRRLGLSDEFYELDSDPLETTNLGTAHVEYQPTADDLSALLSS